MIMCTHLNMLVYAACLVSRQKVGGRGADIADKVTASACSVKIHKGRRTMSRPASSWTLYHSFCWCSMVAAGTRSLWERVLGNQVGRRCWQEKDASHYSPWPFIFRGPPDKSYHKYNRQEKMTHAKRQWRKQTNTQNK